MEDLLPRFLLEDSRSPSPKDYGGVGPPDHSEATYFASEPFSRRQFSPTPSLSAPTFSSPAQQPRHQPNPQDRFDPSGRYDPGYNNFNTPLWRDSLPPQREPPSRNREVKQSFRRKSSPTRNQRRNNGNYGRRNNYEPTGLETVMNRFHSTGGLGYTVSGDRHGHQGQRPYYPKSHYVDQDRDLERDRDHYVRHAREPHGRKPPMKTNWKMKQKFFDDDYRDSNVPKHRGRQQKQTRHQKKHKNYNNRYRSNSDRVRYQKRDRSESSGTNKTEEESTPKVPTEEAPSAAGSSSANSDEVDFLDESVSVSSTNHSPSPTPSNTSGTTTTHSVLKTEEVLPTLTEEKISRVETKPKVKAPSSSSTKSSKKKKKEPRTLKRGAPRSNDSKSKTKKKKKKREPSTKDRTVEKVGSKLEDDWTYLERHVQSTPANDDSSTFQSVRQSCGSVCRASLKVFSLVWSWAYIVFEWVSKVMLYLVRFFYEMHKHALRAIGDHHLLFRFSFLYGFPKLTEEMLFWAPPWSPHMVWCLFASHISIWWGFILFFVPPEVLSSSGLLQQLNPSERMVIAYVLCAVRRQDMGLPLLITVLVFMSFLSLFLGEYIIVQWFVFLVATFNLDVQNVQGEKKVNSFVPPRLIHDDVYHYWSKQQPLLHINLQELHQLSAKSVIRNKVFDFEK